MNERIQQLARQATEYYSNGQERTFDKEKFAELIVRECSKVIVNGGYRNPALGEKYPLTPPEIATMIKEHFGVEE
jgi:hypothetical protein